ncbi:CoA transferase [Actinobacteria bacterium IMCC26103]|nr:CoA transferase [Actinobacteria bacterium IMCC26103]
MSIKQPLDKSDLPLNGILVLDFSQFLAGPVAAMRLADMGARVIKVERPGTGDIGRTLAFAGLEKDGDTLSFHIMNRNKESFAADLKNSEGLAQVWELVKKADVIIQNFRPGVIERLGLGYEDVEKVNPRIVYGSATGYGAEGPFKDRPGQDLLAQSISGLPWLNGRAGDPPIPVGLAVADIFTSTHLASGVIALLLRRERTGKGGLVESSLLESMLDLQFELISANLFDPSVVVNRGAGNSAHAFLPAPYGLYPTKNGYLAIAMTPIPALGKLLGVDLDRYEDPKSWWSEQEAIMKALSTKVATQETDHWLAILDAADIWCAPVLTLPELVEHEGFSAIDMVQKTERTGKDGSKVTIPTTRSPMRIDGKTVKHSKGAPHVGEDTEKIRKEFGI